MKSEIRSSKSEQSRDGSATLAPKKELTAGERVAMGMAWKLKRKGGSGWFFEQMRQAARPPGNSKSETRNSKGEQSGAEKE